MDPRGSSRKKIIIKIITNPRNTSPTTRNNRISTTTNPSDWWKNGLRNSITSRKNNKSILCIAFNQWARGKEAKSMEESTATATIRLKKTTKPNNSNTINRTPLTRNCWKNRGPEIHYPTTYLGHHNSSPTSNPASRSINKNQAWLWEITTTTTGIFDITQARQLRWQKEYQSVQ